MSLVANVPNLVKADIYARYYRCVESNTSGTAQTSNVVNSRLGIN